MTDTTASAVAPGASVEAPPTSPGALLRLARERAGLGPEDLAGQLKLAKSTLEALERDDFAALSEPVYVRGYYRKIAKLLPIDEAELIAAYDARNKPARHASAPTVQRIPLAGGVAAGTSRQYRGQGIGVGAVLVVVLVALYLLTGREPTPRLATRTSPPPVSAPTTAPAEAVTEAPAAEVPAASSLTEQPEVAAPVTSAPSANAPVSSVAPSISSDSVPAVPNQLVLEFSEASFLRVEDSRSRTLVVGLVHGGERRTLDGQPPYTVLLGSSKNVKVYFAGQPVDFSSHISQNGTARFTVP